MKRELTYPLTESYKILENRLNSDMVIPPDLDKILYYWRNKQDYFNNKNVWPKTKRN